MKPERVESEVDEMVAELIRTRHRHLLIMEATVAVLYMVERDGAGLALPCLKDGHHHVLGKASVVPLKWRAHGCADAEILLDLAGWRARAASPARQRALLDHELRHLNLALDPEGVPQWDELERPRLRLRPHDYEVGWFEETAFAFGDDSPEVEYAREVNDFAGPIFLPFIHGRPASLRLPVYWTEERLEQLEREVEREKKRRAARDHVDDNVIRARAWIAQQAAQVEAAAERRKKSRHEPKE